ncbi:MAG TPA: Kdo hydroxylase family protein [Rhizomicrobium sp.]
MDAIRTFDVTDWGGPLSAGMRDDASNALESGKVLFFPHLSFALTDEEQAFLTPEVSNGKSKNVSLKPSGGMGGTSLAGQQAGALKAMMQRFAAAARDLVCDLIPSYTQALEAAQTSFRPVEIEGREASPIHDDTRLHVDAFPSRPMAGRRIMRVFSNINPHGKPRLWHVGEPFEAMAQRFLPQSREGSRLHAAILGLLGITKGTRTAYDSLMLGLHDGAKLDETYQRTSPQIAFPFPAGATWICYTDQVMHAALAGQFVLEQTFHLDVNAMVEPARAPLRVLESVRGHALI